MVINDKNQNMKVYNYGTNMIYDHLKFALCFKFDNNLNFVL